MSEWEILIPTVNADDAPPSVRRLAVPGGWLYQIEHYELLSGTRRVTRCWHPPVFVADKEALT